LSYDFFGSDTKTASQEGEGKGGKEGGDEEIFLCSGVKHMEILIGHI
jgi:hypothetical protein